MTNNLLDKFNYVLIMWRVKIFNCPSLDNIDKEPINYYLQVKGNSLMVKQITHNDSNKSSILFYLKIGSPEGWKCQEYF
jgi:hypothetical protein